MGLRKAVRISMGTGNCVQPSLVGSTPPGYTGLVAVVRPGNTTDPGDLEIYYNTLSAVAQMFRAFSSDNGSPSVLLFGLPDGVEAARFCMVAQVRAPSPFLWPPNRGEGRAWLRRQGGQAQRGRGQRTGTGG